MDASLDRKYEDSKAKADIICMFYGVVCGYYISRYIHYDYITYCIILTCYCMLNSR